MAARVADRSKCASGSLVSLYKEYCCFYSIVPKKMLIFTREFFSISAHLGVSKPFEVHGLSGPLKRTHGGCCCLLLSGSFPAHKKSTWYFVLRINLVQYMVDVAAYVVSSARRRKHRVWFSLARDMRLLPYGAHSPSAVCCCCRGLCCITHRHKPVRVYCCTAVKQDTTTDCACV